MYVAGGSSRIDIHTLDPNRGTLEKRGTGSLRPTDDSGSFPYVARHPSGKFLYALDRLEPPHVVSLAIEDGTAACDGFRGLPSVRDRLLTSTSTPQDAGCWWFTIIPGRLRLGAASGSRRRRGKSRPDAEGGKEDPHGPGGPWRQLLFRALHQLRLHRPVPLRRRSRGGWNRMNRRWPPPTREPVPGTWRFIDRRFAYAVNETNSTVHSWRYDDATAGSPAGRR